MIFAAYAGTGKSYVAQKYDNILDMVIVPYKYKFPEGYRKEQFSALESQNVEYVLCYPEKSLKEEYRRRYQKRGNEETFIRIFIDNWDMWMSSFEKRCCKKYVMHQGEFLSDFLERYIADK